MSVPGPAQAARDDVLGAAAARRAEHLDALMSALDALGERLERVETNYTTLNTRVVALENVRIKNIELRLLGTESGFEARIGALEAQRRW
jgi:hypothetical protein